jgi:N,N-dimethylformamidase
MGFTAPGRELVGYTDKWSYAPGDVVSLHVSATDGRVDVDLVRVRHGDPNPAGPGLQVQPVNSAVAGTYPAAEQRILAGSYAVLDASSAGGPAERLSLWMWTLLPAAGHPQTLLARGHVAVYLDEDGGLAARVGAETVLASGSSIAVRRWHHIELHLGDRPQLWCDGTLVASADHAVEPPDGPVFLATAPGPGGTPTHHFNGRIEELRLDDRVHDVRELGLVNGPTLAVTGRHWDDDTTDFRAAPEQYAAVHFHEDDMDDARWPVTATWSVPGDLPTGIYALRLRSGDLVDHVPFVVTPPRGTATADIAFLLPTLTYLAYSNERMIAAGDGMVPTGGDIEPAEADHWLAAHPGAGASVYDRHPDGTGVCLVSMRRPTPNFRPDFVWWNTGAPERFGSDLYIADFLDHRGEAWDALTDHDLHEQGIDLLRRYRVVVTGTHPEYCSRQMLVAIQEYLEGGGRLMYLGGNGFYWVTSIDPDKPYRAEIRRGINGTRAWSSLPGELRHQTTGELGGLWRYRDRSPNELVGVGFTAQSDSRDRAAGYRRTAESRRPEYQWIFDGVTDAPVLGDYGLYLGGAAGYEIDRHDPELGSPAESVVLMSSAGMHSATYLKVVEDMEVTVAEVTGPTSPDVRSDVVLRPYPGGGAVFSVGSCSWAGSLSHNGYDNDIYRITDNVLTRFASRP